MQKRSANRRRWGSRLASRFLIDHRNPPFSRPRFLLSQTPLSPPVFHAATLPLSFLFLFFSVSRALDSHQFRQKSLSFLLLISESARSFERSGFAFAERKLIDREKRDYVTSLSITILFFSRVLKARDKTADFVPSEKTCDENSTLSLSE